MDSTIIIRIIVVLLIIFAILFVRRARQEARRRKLINNPPERAVIEVCLPWGVNDSNKRMMEFYSRVRSQAESDDQMRKQGLGSIQILYLAERPTKADQVQIRWFLYCDPDRMETVKRFLRRAFDNTLAKISIPEEDPLKKYMDELKPIEEETQADNEG